MAKRILVADDNPMIRKMLCRLFAIEEDYDICAEAENGREAIELALHHRPDLIILDLAMPVLNGLEAARELRKIIARRSDYSLYSARACEQRPVRLPDACGSNRSEDRCKGTDGACESTRPSVNRSAVARQL